MGLECSTTHEMGRKDKEIGCMARESGGSQVLKA